MSLMFSNRIKKMENMLELIQNTLQPIYLMDVENMSKLIYEYSFPVFNKNCECNYFKKWWGCCYVADKRKKFKKNIKYKKNNQTCIDLPMF